MSINHLKNSLAEGKFLDAAFGRLPVKGDLCFSRSDGTYVYAFSALGEGQWQEIEALFWKGKRLLPSEYNFHSGALSTGFTSGAQQADAFFSKDVPHSRTAGVGYRVPVNLADADTNANPPDSMELIAKTKLCGDWNAAGIQTGFSYTTNPARQIVQLLVDYARLPRYAAFASAAAYVLSRIDFGAWAMLRDFYNTTELNDYRTIADLPGIGLRAKYYAGDNFQTFSEQFLAQNFDIGYVGQPPATVTQIPLSARFEGYAKFPTSETYTIYIRHDDGVRLYINNNLLIDQFVVADANHSATYAATADVFTPIKIEWFDGGGAGALKVEWESASQTRQVIPLKYLYPIEEQRPVYESHIFFSAPIKPLDAVREILRISNGAMQDANGKIRFLALDTLASSFAFDATNIIEGTFKAAPPNALRSSPVTEYRAKMRDANTRFVESPTVPPSVFPNRLTSREIENVAEIELYSMTIWQARKVLAMTDKLTNEAARYDWNSFEAQSYPVLENDLVTVAHRKTGNIVQTFRVTQASDAAYDHDGNTPPQRQFTVSRWTSAGDGVIAPTFDADAAAYLNALGIPNDSTVFYSGTAQQITGAGIWAAVDTLVKGMKTNSLWTKIKAMYPFIGGTAARHKFNLKNPVDTDAGNRVAYFGTWIHSATGAKPDGATAYANTFFNPVANGLTYDNNHLSFYSKTAAAGGGTAFYDMGMGDSNGNGNLALWSRRANDTAGYDSGFFQTNRASASNSDGSGFFLGNSNSPTGKLIRNSSIIATRALSQQAFYNANVFIGGYNEADTGTIYFSNKETAFASIGNGLTDTDAANFYNLVQALETALFRQI